MPEGWKHTYKKVKYRFLKQCNTEKWIGLVLAENKEQVSNMQKAHTCWKNKGDRRNVIKKAKVPTRMGTKEEPNEELLNYRHLWTLHAEGQTWQKVGPSAWWINTTAYLHQASSTLHWRRRTVFFQCAVHQTWLLQVRGFQQFLLQINLSSKLVGQSKPFMPWWEKNRKAFTGLMESSFPTMNSKNCHLHICKMHLHSVFLTFLSNWAKGFHTVPHSWPYNPVQESRLYESTHREKRTNGNSGIHSFTQVFFLLVLTLCIQ